MNLLIKRDYFERFYEFKKEGLTHELAYEKLEDELLNKYGINRYSSFESFERSFYRYINFEFRKV